MAPVFSFQKISKGSNHENLYIAGGNFFDVIPYEGRYDAQALALFAINKKNNISHLPQRLLSEYDGQVRDIKWLKTGHDKNRLMVAGNDKPLKILRVSK